MSGVAARVKHCTVCVCVCECFCRSCCRIVFHLPAAVFFPQDLTHTPRDLLWFCVLQCSVCEVGWMDGRMDDCVDRKLVAESNTLIRRRRVRTASVRVTSPTTEELFRHFHPLFLLSHFPVSFSPSDCGCASASDYRQGNPSVNNTWYLPTRRETNAERFHPRRSQP